MPRYVILRHEMPPHRDRPTHWDLMLDTGGSLATWALPEPPQSDKVLRATRLADHRLEYLDFEGPVSGDRGRVTRWDTGQYCLESQSPHAWCVSLAGQQLTGRLSLQAVGDDSSQWTVQFVAGREA